MVGYTFLKLWTLGRGGRDMGKSLGSLRATAGRSGLRISKLSARQSSGGKYKYAIRGDKANMRAANLSDARYLIRAHAANKRR